MSALAPILVYATRYALGRRSGAALDVEQAIAENLHVFTYDRGSLAAIARDIREAADLGDACDRECWMRTLGRLEALRLPDGQPLATGECT